MTSVNMSAYINTLYLNICRLMTSLITHTYVGITRVYVKCMHIYTSYHLEIDKLVRAIEIGACVYSV